MKQIPDTARRHHVNRASPVRRPALPRAQPIRNFAGVFGAPPPSKGAARPERDRPEPEKTRRQKGAGKKKQPMAAPAAAVARGVNAGYRVIEEYVRQGQQFARSLWPATAGGAAPADRGGGTSSRGAAEVPMNMTERLIRSASDLAGLFSEFLQTFSLPGTLPAPGSTPIPDFGIGRQPGSAQAAAAPPRNPAPRADSAEDDRAALAREAAPTVSIDLRSNRRTEITADLRPGSWSDRLLIHDLRPLDGSAKSGRLSGVTAASIVAERRVVITVAVPDALPAATYSGLIVDADSNLPRGTLSIRVFGDGPPRRARKAARK